MTDGTGTSSYSCDEADRLLAVTSPGPKTVAYRYDRDGNRTKLIYPDATAVTYTFDKASRMSGFTDWAARSVGLSGVWSFDKFSKRYYDYYVDELPNDALRDEERDFYFRVQERIDWTHADPDPVSRQYGWISTSEYLDWLRSAYSTYLRERRSRA